MTTPTRLELLQLLFPVIARGVDKESDLYATASVAGRLEPERRAPALAFIEDLLHAYDAERAEQGNGFLLVDGNDPQVDLVFMPYSAYQASVDQSMLLGVPPNDVTRNTVRWYESIDLDECVPFSILFYAGQMMSLRCVPRALVQTLQGLQA